MKTPHKHAALMAEYAEDAAETETPWKRWEFQDGNTWNSFTYSPSWDCYMNYRRKPRTININGHEVPEPYRGEIENGTDYYTPCLGHAKSQCYQWDGGTFDETKMKQGLVHLTKEAAEAHTKALISFTEL